ESDDDIESQAVPSGTQGVGDAAVADWMKVDEEDVGNEAGLGPASSVGKKPHLEGSKGAATAKVQVRLCKICHDSSRDVEWFEACILWQDPATGDVVTTPVGWVCRVCGEVCEAFIEHGNVETIIEKFNNDPDFKAQFSGGRMVRMKTQQPTWCPQSVVLRHVRDFALHQDVAFIEDTVFRAHFKAPLDSPQVLPYNAELVDWEGTRLKGVFMTLESARARELPYKIVTMRSMTQCLLDTQLLRSEETLHPDHARQMWNFEDRTQRDGRPKMIMGKNLSKIESYDHYATLAKDYNAAQAAAGDRALHGDAGGIGGGGGGGGGGGVGGGGLPGGSFVSRSRFGASSAASAMAPPPPTPVAPRAKAKAGAGSGAAAAARSAAASGAGRSAKRASSAVADVSKRSRAGGRLAAPRGSGRFESEAKLEASGAASDASGGAASAATCVVTPRAATVRSSPPTKSIDEGIGVSIEQILVHDFQPGRQIAGARDRIRKLTALGQTTEAENLKSEIELANAARNCQCETLKTASLIDILPDMEALHEEGHVLPAKSAMIYMKMYGQSLLNDGKYLEWVKCVWPRSVAQQEENGSWSIPPPLPASDWSCIVPRWSVLVSSLSQQEGSMEFWWGTLFNDGFLSLLGELEDPSRKEITSEQVGGMFSLANAFVDFYHTENSRVQLSTDFQDLLVPMLRVLRGIVAVSCSFPCVAGSTAEDVDFVSPTRKAKAKIEAGVIESLDQVADACRTAKALRLRLRNKSGVWVSRIDEFRRVVGAESTTGVGLVQLHANVSTMAHDLAGKDVDEQRDAIIGLLKAWMEGHNQWQSPSFRSNTTPCTERLLAKILVFACPDAAWTNLPCSDSNKEWVDILTEAAKTLQKSADAKTALMRIQEQSDAWMQRSSEVMLLDTLGHDIHTYTDFKNLYDALKRHTNKAKGSGVPDLIITAIWRSLAWAIQDDTPWAQVRDVGDMAKMVLSTDTSMREFWESQQRTKEAITDCQKISLANAVCLDYSKQPGALADTTGKGTEIASVMLTAYKKLVAFMEKPPEFTDVPVGQETFAKLA
ncbi:unnamed protein product, partial [Prorocentrum cordatum]